MVDFAAHTARMIHRLGRPVTVTPSGQPARQVLAVFSTNPASALGMIDGYAPSLVLAAADAVSLARGDAVEVADVGAFTVSAVRADPDAGEVVASLEQA